MESSHNAIQSVTLDTALVLNSEGNVPVKRRKIDRIENERKYIHKLLDKHLLTPGEQYRHIVPVSHTDSNISLPDVDDFLMLDVIYWDLSIACQRAGIPCKLKCPQCGSDLTAVPLGPKKRFMMRRLYCLDECVILMTTMFRCAGLLHRQELLGYDPRLLRSFPQLELPFLLFHRAGTTRKFATHVWECVSNETKMAHVHEDLGRRYKNSLNKRRDEYLKACSSYQFAQTDSVENLYFDNLSIDHSLSCPSVTLVNQCCLAMFEENENLFKTTMNSVKAHEYIYIDDTFKIPLSSSLAVPSKRKSTGPSFKTVLVVLNEKKQIMAWQLTRENVFNFNEAKPLLEGVKQRHGHEPLRGCFTNRCCEWSGQLRTLFGERFAVKANREFVLENIADLMMKTKNDCISGCDTRSFYDEFNSVFRDQDVAKTFTAFLSQWRNWECCKSNETLTGAIAKEISEIEPHVTKGCYSDIPVVGVNATCTSVKFLDVHDQLQKYIVNARLGIPLSMAMLSLGLYEFNLRQGVLPIDSNNTASSISAPLKKIFPLTSSKMSKLNCVIELFERWMSSKNISEDNTDIVATQSDYSHHMLRFLMYLKSYRSIVNFVPDILSAPRLVPYFLSPLHLISVPYFLKSSEINTEYFNDVETLRACVNKLKFDHWKSSGDDLSSLLYCVVVFLQNLATNTTSRGDIMNCTAQYFTYFRDNHGLDFASQSLDVLLATSKSRVEMSVPFHELNVFECIANTFGVVVLIITNLRRFPVLPVYPECWHPKAPPILMLLQEDSHTPILLDLDSNPNGGEEIPLDSKFKSFRCRCGRGKAVSGQKPKCVRVEGSRYSSRCLCLRAGESCSSICYCRCCNNPHGARLKSHVATDDTCDTNELQKHRQRNKHEGQELVKKILSRVPFQPTGELENSTWTFMEYILFEYALNLIAEDLNSEEDNLLTWSNVPIIIDCISDKYNFLVDVCTTIDDIGKWAKRKECADLEKRYIERQEDITTDFDMIK